MNKAVKEESTVVIVLLAVTALATVVMAYPAAKELFHDMFDKTKDQPKSPDTATSTVESKKGAEAVALALQDQTDKQFGVAAHGEGLDSNDARISRDTRERDNNSFSEAITYSREAYRDVTAQADGSYSESQPSSQPHYSGAGGSNGGCSGAGGSDDSGSGGGDNDEGGNSHEESVRMEEATLTNGEMAVRHDLLAINYAYNTLARRDASSQELESSYKLLFNGRGQVTKTEPNLGYCGIQKTYVTKLDGSCQQFEHRRCSPGVSMGRMASGGGSCLCIVPNTCTFTVFKGYSFDELKANIVHTSVSDLSPGHYRVGEAIYFANGVGHFCSETGVEYAKIGSPAYTQVGEIPSAMINDGVCQLPQGFYRVGGAIYFASESGHFCSETGTGYAKRGNPAYTQVDGIPNTMINDGVCQFPQGFYRLGGAIYFASESGHFCAETGAGYAKIGSPAYTQVEGIPNTMINDGVCQ